MHAGQDIRYKVLNGLISTGFDQAEKNAAQDGLDLAGELIAALSRQTQPIRTAQFVIDTSNRIVEVRQQLQQQQLQQQLPAFRSLALPPAALDAARKKHEKESVKLATAEADATEMEQALVRIKRRISSAKKAVKEAREVMEVGAEQAKRTQ